MEYKEILDPDSDEVIQFHNNVLVEAFPDAHVREDVNILKRNLKEGSWTNGSETCRYHLIVAYSNNNIIGGVSFYFFSSGGNALGMGSYLGVRKEFCSQGIGTKLVGIRDHTLYKDAQELDRYLKGLVIQVHDPSLMSLEEIRWDSLDPWKREQFWNRRGYRKIAFNFIQPSIRDGESPVEYLSLHIFPYCQEWENIKQISKADLGEIIYCFIKCTGTVGLPESDPAYIRMKAELSRQEYFWVL